MREFWLTVPIIVLDADFMKKLLRLILITGSGGIRNCSSPGRTDLSSLIFSMFCIFFIFVLFDGFSMFLIVNKY